MEIMKRSYINILGSRTRTDHQLPVADPNHIPAGTRLKFIIDLHAACNAVKQNNTRSFKMNLMVTRVLLPDGTLLELHRSVRASELTQAIVKHLNLIHKLDPYIDLNPSCRNISNSNSAASWLLCESTSLQIGKRPCPLSLGANLQPGKLYFVFPLRVFQTRLTSSHLSILVAAATSALLQLSSASLIYDQNSSYISLLKFCANFCTHHSPYSTDDVLAGIDEETWCRYVDRLIQRSCSWWPELETVHELS